MNKHIKYLILGGGPAGLALAATLMDKEERNFLVLEKENEPGGLCRSKEVDGAPLDIGGGHLLDVRRPQVLDFIFRYLPIDEWQLYERITRIATPHFEIDYPYEANIWQLPIDDQVEHLMSIMNAGSNQGKPMPSGFEDWIVWKLGEVIARNYMLPYNRKIFAGGLEQLGTYWLEKLPNVSFEDTLRSCLRQASFGSIPAHAQFYYPRRYGYGEVFLRIGESLGKRLICNTPVTSIDFETLTVNGTIQADWIINTTPWPELKNGKNLPSVISNQINLLMHNSLDVVYRPGPVQTNAHWIYFSDEKLPYHRILYRQNFLPGSHGAWEEINTLRSTDSPLLVHRNKYAYPLNTRQKPQAIKTILEWARGQNIFGLGRWGEWEHMNSDIAISKALSLAEQLTA